MKPHRALNFPDQVVLLASVFLFVSVAGAQEWTRFRGPNGQGISAAKTIPVKWTENDYHWKVKLAGGGHSSPVVWQDIVYVTGADTQKGIGYLQADCEHKTFMRLFTPLAGIYEHGGHGRGVGGSRM